jgi:hypothetical protein
MSKSQLLITHLDNENKIVQTVRDGLFYHGSNIFIAVNKTTTSEQDDERVYILAGAILKVETQSSE